MVSTRSFLCLLFRLFYDNKRIVGFCIQMTMILFFTFIGVVSANKECITVEEWSDIKVSCQTSNLYKIFPILPKNVTTLDLSFSDIPVLGRLPKLPHLRTFEARRCGIKKIRKDAFQDTPAIETIELDRNQIKKIPDFLPATLSRLRKLSLSYNRIRRLDNSLSMLENLEILDLQGNKELKRTDENVFAKLKLKILAIDATGLSTLKGIEPLRDHLDVLSASNIHPFFSISQSFLEGFYLNDLTLDNDSINDLRFLRRVKSAYIYLNHNPIGSLRIISNFSSLSVTRGFFLKNCSLRSVNNEDLSRLTSVQELNLSENLIEYVQLEAFVNLKNLRTLDLSGNLLTNVPVAVKLLLPTASILISNNPLLCDCQSNWLMETNLRNKLKAQLDCAAVNGTRNELLYNSFQCSQPSFAVPAFYNSSDSCATCIVAAAPRAAIYFLCDGIVYGSTSKSIERRQPYLTQASFCGNCFEIECVASNFQGTIRQKLSTNLESHKSHMSDFKLTIVIIVSFIMLLLIISIVTYSYLKRKYTVNKGVLWLRVKTWNVNTNEPLIDNDDEYV
ncbi:unnamed protein product [Dimorphilus gyrociliatus]|uniref:Uncharacterized protein n=1 Tax=Dimorphilus gyrociliatus TaxID=2664684 RepID=A0A7I8V8W4_9ANNE|nr:unnamed protein product [Dimorphilus gyrociliatus]